MWCLLQLLISAVAVQMNVLLCSNETLFTKKGSGPDLAHSYCLSTPDLKFQVQHTCLSLKGFPQADFTLYIQSGL